MTDAIVTERSMTAGRTFDPSRTYWQFLFPLDAVEERSVERNGKRETVRLTYDRDYLNELVSNFRSMQGKQSEHGASPQPLPVSLHHAIENRVYHGEVNNLSDLRRYANVIDLHFSASSDEHPAGLWGLTEWTSEGDSLVRSGAQNMLSPTTVRPHRMTDGTVLPGDSLIAVGLVDVPALDYIGTALDRLPHDAFPTSAKAASIDAAPKEHATNSQNQFRAHTVITRSAIHVDAHRMEQSKMDQNTDSTEIATQSAESGADTAEATAAPTDVSARADDADDSAAPDLSKVVEAVETLLERMGTVEDTMRGLVKRMDEMGESSDGESSDGGSEDTEVVAEASDYVARAARDAAIEAAKLATSAATKEALELVSRGRLLSGDASRYVEDKVSGRDVSRYVGSFAAVAARSGSSAETTVDTAPDAEVTQWTSETIRARAIKRVGDNPHPRAILREMNKIEDEILARGGQIVA